MIVAVLLWLALVGVAGVALVEVALPRRAATDALERAVLAVGLGYGWAVVAGLALNATPWGLRGAPFAAATAALVVAVAGAVAAAGRRRPGLRPTGRPRPLGRRDALAVAGVLAFAALFRLTHLGWSEFQGDEALVLHKAAATIDGRHDAIYVHKKGPAEILVTAEVYAMTRRIDEGAARLPFALAMLAGLTALVVVGRGLFGPGAHGMRVGALAAVILSLNGFFIAFGRVVQYQALVFLFGTLAVWCAWRYRHAEDDGEDGRAADRWLVLCALFLACGLLSHYDAGLVAPAAGYLVISRWRAVPGSLRRERLAVAAAVVLGAVLLAAFYVPLVQHPYFRSTTLKYLVDVRLGGGGGGGAPYNALPKWAGLANFYNHWNYLLVLGVLVAAAVTPRLMARWPRHGWVAVLLGILGVPALLLRPQWFALTDDVEGRSWAIVVVAALVILPLVASRRDAAWTTVWLWFAAPFVFYATLVESPRTHFHTVFPALALLAAIALAPSFTASHPSPNAGGGVGDRRSPGVRAAEGVMPVIAGLAAAYSAAYSWLVFVQHDVLYKRAYPEVIAPVFPWYPFPDLPSSGWFGFPYRAGWKAAGGLMQLVAGDYDSNEEPAVTAWYTRGAPRCGNRPALVFVASRVQDPKPVLDPTADEAPDAPPSLTEMSEAGYDNRSNLGANSADFLNASMRRDLSQRRPDRFPAVGSMRVGQVDFGIALADGRWVRLDTPADFDTRLSGPHYDAGLPFDRPERLVDTRRDDVIGDPSALRLNGWRLDSGGDMPGVVATGQADEMIGQLIIGGAIAASPTDRLILTLAWTPLAPLPPNAQVFVHLEREGERTIGQDDGPVRTPVETVCGEPRALASLAPGEAVLDRRVIDIAADAPPGAYDLLVGIYDYETGERLPVSGGPDAGATRVRLATVNVAAALSP